MSLSCDLLKIHYLCGDKDNVLDNLFHFEAVVICSKFITFAVTKTTISITSKICTSCDLLKIHYLCGDKDNLRSPCSCFEHVVICSKFITFAVTKTTTSQHQQQHQLLWFAQNSLPLRWQRQHFILKTIFCNSCDLLKIHYLCGDKDNLLRVFLLLLHVVICSKFITFAVTKTTQADTNQLDHLLWFAQNSLPLRWQRQPDDET